MGPEETDLDLGPLLLSLNVTDSTASGLDGSLDRCQYLTPQLQ